MEAPRTKNTLSFSYLLKLNHSNKNPFNMRMHNHRSCTSLFSLVTRKSVYPSNKRMQYFYCEYLATDIIWKERKRERSGFVCSKVTRGINTTVIQHVKYYTILYAYARENKHSTYYRIVQSFLDHNEVCIFLHRMRVPRKHVNSNCSL